MKRKNPRYKRTLKFNRTTFYAYVLKLKTDYIMEERPGWQVVVPVLDKLLTDIKNWSPKADKRFQGSTVINQMSWWRTVNLK